MTREEIAEELLAVVVELGNSTGQVGDDPVAIARRAYIRGLASGAILMLRDCVLSQESGASMRNLVDAGRAL